MNIIKQLKDKFLQEFSAQPEIVCSAPGRVNLIGDHTDYNEGFVLPVAIDYGTYIAASPRNDRIVKLISLDMKNGQIEFSLDQIEKSSNDCWGNYVKGTLIALKQTHTQITGANMVISGDIPQGAGLSSSASFEIAILQAFVKLNHLVLTGRDAAIKGQQAENDFVGCNCGIMDQLISALGKNDHAMLLDCRNLHIQHIGLPRDLSIVVINSNVKRGLVSSEYNIRREQCEQAAKLCGKESLRDVSLAELNAVKSKLDPILFRRAHHVIAENDRVLQMRQALIESNVSAISRLMKESHQSLQYDFEVTTEEVDILVNIVANTIDEQGGVRMTGGGFGGCVVALVPNHLVEKVKHAVEIHYELATGLSADVYQVEAVDGAFS